MKKCSKFGLRTWAWDDSDSLKVSFTLNMVDYPIHVLPLTVDLCISKSSPFLENFGIERQTDVDWTGPT